MKAMLSQPMAGKSEEEIKATREKAIATLKEKGYEIVNTLFTDECCTDSSLLFSKIIREHESLPCSIFLQGLGTGKRLPT